MKNGFFLPLALKREILEVRKYGKTIKSELISIKFLKKNSNKVAFIIRKKIGIAVKRNRIKNQLRATIRKNTFFETTPIYCILKVNDTIKTASFEQIKEELEKILLTSYNQIKRKP